MTKHPTIISGYFNMNDLAEQVNNLRYDVLSEFLYNLSIEMKISSSKDKKRGKDGLADSLTDASNCLMNAADCIDLSWQVSWPHMKEETE